MRIAADIDGGHELGDSARWGGRWEGNPTRRRFERHNGAILVTIVFGCTGRGGQVDGSKSRCEHEHAEEEIGGFHIRILSAVRTKASTIFNHGTTNLTPPV